MIGLNIGGIGLGAGERLSGINLAGIGAGAGKELKGLTMAGIAAGAPRVRGLVMAGGVVGGQDLKGAFLSGICIYVPKDGRISGLAASPFNFIKGSQSGVSIGIVNYARSVDGVQIGIISNIVRDNPSIPESASVIQYELLSVEAGFKGRLHSARVLSIIFTLLR